MIFHVSPADEFFKLVKGFWDITEVLNDVEVNKFKAKNLTVRRNGIKRELEVLPEPFRTQAKNKLEEFDSLFIGLMKEFTRKNFGYKFLFRKADFEKFRALDSALEGIQKLCNIQFRDDIRSRHQYNQDTLSDFRAEKKLFVNHYHKIPAETKKIIKNNFSGIVDTIRTVAQDILQSGNNDIVNVNNLATDIAQLTMEDLTTIPSILDGTTSPDIDRDMDDDYDITVIDRDSSVRQDASMTDKRSSLVRRSINFDLSPGEAEEGGGRGDKGGYDDLALELADLSIQETDGENSTARRNSNRASGTTAAVTRTSRLNHDDAPFRQYLPSTS